MSLPDDLPFHRPLTPHNYGAPEPRKHVRHRWVTAESPDGWPGRAGVHCSGCGKPKDETASRRGRNNRKRGNAAELAAARGTGGRKVGPLGYPWDVEMPGYARLQVRKLAHPPSLRNICRALAAIGSGAEMPGYIWIEPGRGGERLIVFRLADFAERHGVPDGGDDA